MPKRVILITGTPCVGKTTISTALTAQLNALYVNLTQLATEKNLILGKDEKRNSIIIDEKQMTKAIANIIKETPKNNIIIDGHYAPNVVPKALMSFVFVLRRDPAELRKFMQHCRYSEQKMLENLAAEILDVCLVDALNASGKGKVCEINATSKSVEQITEEVLAVLNGKSECCVGIVDWLGKLESEGKLEEYLKI